MTPPTCSVGTCDKPAIARGLCTTHYRRWNRNGDVGEDVPVVSPGAEKPNCRVDGCDRKVISKTTMLCRVHTYNIERYGTLERPQKQRDVKLCAAGCGRPAVTHGYCMAHWKRVQTYGYAYDDVPIGDTNGLYRAVANNVRKGKATA